MEWSRPVGKHSKCEDNALCPCWEFLSPLGSQHHLSRGLWKEFLGPLQATASITLPRCGWYFHCHDSPPKIISSHLLAMNATSTLHSPLHEVPCILTAVVKCNNDIPGSKADTGISGSTVESLGEALTMQMPKANEHQGRGAGKIVRTRVWGSLKALLPSEKMKSKKETELSRTYPGWFKLLEIWHQPVYFRYI